MHKFTYLADAFIWSDLQYIQVIYIFCQYVFPGNWTHNLCAANAMLYQLSHRNTLLVIIIIGLLSRISISVRLYQTYIQYLKNSQVIQVKVIKIWIFQS